jgi:type II secretory ATPase GspE/PulE/Tfp pilus assembly ATPase PilB-like protein
MTSAITLAFPLPPLCASNHDSVVKPGDRVVVRLQSGVILKGLLTTFDPNEGLITLITSDKKLPAAVRLDMVKTLHLPALRQWSKSELPSRENNQAITLPTENQEFKIEFKDGDNLAGKTIGCRTDRNGLYVFPLYNENQFLCVFVPHGFIKNYNIGPPIGVLLVKERLVTEQEIDASLKIQTEKRQKPLGEYLRDSALITALDWDRAMDIQGTTPSIKIGGILVKEGLISSEQLDTALVWQKQNRQQPLGEILVSQGLISKADFQFALAKKLGFPYVDLKKFEIDNETVKLIPEELARKHGVLPLCISDDKLLLAMENPMSWEALEEVRFHTGKHVDVAIASREEMERIIERVFSAEDLGSLSFEECEGWETEETEPIGETGSIIVELVNKIIIGAANRGASDIHIEPDWTGENTVVRIRKDGRLIHFYEIPPTLRRAVPIRIKVMAGMNIAVRRTPQDGKISFRRAGKQSIELRVVTLPTVGGQEDVVLRILSGGKPLPLAELGLSQRNQQQLMPLIDKPSGLIIVCGPTGSGKTTTLHSILALLNIPDRKIWTAEDPVEIVQKGLRQVQVFPKIGLDFAAVMRSFLRADPDVIMLGEMRDQETAHTCIEASLTGHLVFSTLHTNSAAESVVRLLEMNMNPFNFADSLLGILAQRLTRTLCSHCKQAYRPASNELNSLLVEYCKELDAVVISPEQAKTMHKNIAQEWKQRFADPSGHFTLYRPVGCEECEHGGYKGRIGIHELLVANSTLKKQIVDAAPVSNILATAINAGMRTLKQDGIEKVLQGMTDLLQVRKVCLT